MVPVPGMGAPDFINSLSTLKKVKRWLNDLYLAFDPMTYEIGIDHPFWDLFMCLHQRVIAGGGWVKNLDGNLLIIERKGKLDMPKGKLEKNEDIAECAVREVKEECKLPGCEIVGQAIKTYHCYKDKGEFILKTTYWYPMSNPGVKKLKPQKEEGISAVYWATPDQLEVRMREIPSYNSLQDAFEQFVATGKVY